ncbi:MAG: galactose oxidase [Nitrospinaceae bacterium]|jgi:N-acetylneuraminic acid mutarotase|nr:MAG: galactose oxidase [Nitrospinaceae bacterium]
MQRTLAGWFFALTLFLNAPLAAEPPGRWTVEPPLPEKRTESAAALLDGTIYLIGGFTPKGISARVLALNPKTGIWEDKPPLPQPLHHTTATVAGGRLYVIGGFYSGRWSPVATTYEFDPAKNTWTEKASMPTARGALAAEVIDGKIHAIGGARREFFRLVNTGAHEVYDPASDRWDTLPPLPTPRDHLTASAAAGKLYVIGGRVNVDYNQNLSVNEAYDPASHRWTKKKPLPTARSGITSRVLSGRIHVFGGESGEGTFTENEAYDPERDVWTAMAPMPEGLHGLGSVLLDRKIHLLSGGPNPGGGGSDRHFIFELPTP